MKKMGTFFRAVTGLVIRRRPKTSEEKYRLNTGTLRKVLQVIPDLDLMFEVFRGNVFGRTFRPHFLNSPRGSNLLVIAPHQDDDTIGAGGVLLKALREGKSAACVYVTDGCENMAERKQEARTVWADLNGSEPDFLDIPCKQIAMNQENIGKLAAVLRQKKPDTIFLPFILEQGKDHRKTCCLLYETFRKNSDLQAENIEIWQYQTTAMFTPNVLVDISDVLEDKRRLNEFWHSQNRVFDYAHQCYGKDIANSIFFRGTKELRTARPKKPAAELFFVTPLRDYLELAEFYFGSDRDTFYA